MRQHGSGGLWALVSWVPTGRPVHTGGRLPWVILGALGYGVVAGCLALVTQAEECRLPGTGRWGRAGSGGPGPALSLRTGSRGGPSLLSQDRF